MHRFLIAGALALMAGGLGVTRLATLESRLDQFDDFRADGPRRLAVLGRDLARVQEELDGLRGELEQAGSTLDADRESLASRLAVLQDELGATVQGLEALRAEHASFAPAELDARLEELVQSVDGQWKGLSRSLSDATVLAQRNQAQIGRLDAEVSPDVDQRWRDIMGPTVQLAGTSTVGSGVLLESRPLESGVYETLVLTAWHVVRDIRTDAGKDDIPIPIYIYAQDGSRESETAKLLVHDVELDVALLRLNTDERQAYGARLVARRQAASSKVFAPIYAAGCPLGNDPIPTRGEIASVHHEVDGSDYWMISAPTYIGNSGGGVYDEETHELLGIFSKIYTHGNLRPTVVPHMGLVTPLSRIYTWIEEQGHGRLTQDPRTGEIELRLASR